MTVEKKAQSLSKVLLSQIDWHKELIFWSYVAVCVYVEKLLIGSIWRSGVFTAKVNVLYPSV